ncbi:MAG: RNA polymerase sigma factor [Ignavibacteriales bacterium]|nr:MAG: RNA polymerase sigma factor [Ignavibacteriales bacterium]
MEERELVNRLKNGDEEAFRKIFYDNQRKVLNTCYRIVNDKETAEDLTQEVFIKVHSAIKYFRGDSKFSTWIYRIAVTKSLDHLRAKKRKKRFGLLRFSDSSNEMQVQQKISKREFPGDSLENDERKYFLNKALNAIPENQRIAFSLSKYDEMSYQQIADILGISLSAVESLIHRAKKNLEKKLHHYYKNL